MQIKHNYNELYVTDKYEFNDIAFQNLMQQRIINVLLICSNYDYFMLEEDGRINEKIFLEYASINLRYPPQFTQACSSEIAFELLEKKKFDLVITMLNVGKIDAFEMAKTVKSKFPAIPIVVLTHFSREVSMKLANEDLRSIDYVFCWLGNASLLLAIIKLLEDKMNAEYDVMQKGVQAILLVEDSIRYYSSYLPTIYKAIFDQTAELMTEGLNEHEKMLRMRARPKILLAKNFDDALSLYQKYNKNLLGVISDIAYPRNGQMDKESGVKLARLIRKEGSKLPILLQSSDEWSQDIINELSVKFINKYSKILLIELKNYIKENYGFGDFVFMNPEWDVEIERASNLKALQFKLKYINPKSLSYHVSNNHFSRWLKARALFAIAKLFEPKGLNDFNDIEEVRSYLIDTIANYRKTKGRGVIASHIDEYAIFTRLGDGQLGGKARGIAFIDSFIKKHKLMFNWENVVVSIPKTIVLTTDLFDEFMEINKLYEFALKDISDEEVIERFKNAAVPERMKIYIEEICKSIREPLAVRSSSLLEDSHYQPFAGVYSTFMISNNHPDMNVRRSQLEQAIKCVYASVFFRESKAYIAATSNVIDEEKMGIVIQKISGSAYEKRFYPTLSGVARSVNFYPIDPEKYEDGIANIAFGLGKTIVEGGISLRFCPIYPKKVLQLSSPEYALKDSQKEFYALDLDSDKFHPAVEETVNLLKLRVKDAENDTALKYVASTYDLRDQIIRDGVQEGGKKLITFSSILKYDVFPLAEIIQKLLEIGKNEMNNHVEIEFSVNIDKTKEQPQIFHFLQIRPIVAAQEKMQINLDHYSEKDTVIYSKQSLGNGILDNICDIVYVKPDAFDPANTKLIAETVERINIQFVKNKKNYILIGPGRWGSSDPWLGIPVKWAQISAARLIVESGLKDFHIDPSQGTHFFQNLTSFGVGYFTINPYLNDGFYNVNFLNDQKAEFEDNYVRHIRFNTPAVIKIDGRNKKGIIYKPMN
ncbi:MAG TPA: phosphoenolpyruvate synthase [Lentisphaeria bacterium]|nr:MAG: phosphoenolpyruvate synthase [Lentisphaerae bacterium GWF2_38_69]HBM16987.1 phosphoenolpyruvate synthase [Lentisphaeria bacterium]